jgi:putative transposase
MSAFIDTQREKHGVEPTCRVLGVAPSTYYAVKKREREPAPRTLSDRELLVEIRRVHAGSRNRVYGARKVWWQLQREGIAAARCTVERLMRQAGLVGVRRGRRWRTTVPGEQAPRAADLVQRDFRANAPNRLWVCDFTYVATWAGVVYVAFVIDAFSRRIVGWKADTTMKTSLVLDTLEMALWVRDHEGQPVRVWSLTTTLGASTPVSRSPRA